MLRRTSNCQSYNDCTWEPRQHTKKAASHRSPTISSQVCSMWLDSHGRDNHKLISNSLECPAGGPEPQEEGSPTNSGPVLALAGPVPRPLERRFHFMAVFCIEGDIVRFSCIEGDLVRFYRASLRADRRWYSLHPPRCWRRRHRQRS